ncbi:MAG: alcohol dehydrogenase catalytic domain-containing protein, partial [Firmicutes bacterium]|nr:alcohol dehydrogenase catalytic domain-containing protein [Bacillota bacterium]
MKGLIFDGAGRTLVKEFPIPEPGPNDAVIQVKSSAICGSDRHMLMAPHDLLVSGKFGATGAGASAFKYGMASGHEGAGIVYSVGENVTNVKVGDRVTIYHHQGCGHCPACRRGEFNLCEHRKNPGLGLPGTNAEYTVINSACCVPLPDEISFDVGALMGCQVITAYAALRKLQVSGNEPVVIYGLGPLGLIAGVLAKAMGATVVGLDISEYRLNFAIEKECCDYVLNSIKDDCKTWLEDFTKGRGVMKGLVCCGAPQMHWLSSQVAGIRGHIVLVGVSNNALDPNKDAPFSFDSRCWIRRE